MGYDYGTLIIVEALGTLVVAILLMLFIFGWLLRKLFGREVLADTVGDLLRDMILAVWHFIFGAPKVRIERRRRRRRSP